MPGVGDCCWRDLRHCTTFSAYRRRQRPFGSNRDAVYDTLTATILTLA
jgi:hypothetical protein